MTVRDSKVFHTLFLNCGHLTATVKMDKSGFVTGEAVKISASINNHSKVSLWDIKIILLIMAICLYLIGAHSGV